MSETKKQTLTGVVELDGNTFIECEFKDAQLTYRGGMAPSFANCRFTNARFNFEDSAANTVNFLRAMLPLQTNMRQVVFGLMPELNNANQSPTL